MHEFGLPNYNLIVKTIFFIKLKQHCAMIFEQVKTSRNSPKLLQRKKICKEKLELPTVIHMMQNCRVSCKENETLNKLMGNAVKEYLIYSKIKRPRTSFLTVLDFQLSQI